MLYCSIRSWRPLNFWLAEASRGGESGQRLVQSEDVVNAKNLYSPGGHRKRRTDRNMRPVRRRITKQLAKKSLAGMPDEDGTPQSMKYVAIGK